MQYSFSLSLISKRSICGPTLDADCEINFYWFILEAITYHTYFLLSVSHLSECFSSEHFVVVENEYMMISLGDMASNMVHE